MASRWLARRAFTALAVCALLQALCIILTALNPWPNQAFFKLLTPSNLPASLAGLSIALALLLAPALTLRPDESGVSQPNPKDARATGLRALFAGCWLAGAGLFFLLVASRLSAVPSDNLLRAALVLGVTGTFAAAFAAFFPRAYLGAALFWAIGLPILAYLLTETFYALPHGSMGWQRATSPEALRLKSTVHTLLEFSPGTAMVGAVQGQLPGGEEMGWKAALKFVAFCGLSSIALMLIRRRWTAPVSAE